MTFDVRRSTFDVRRSRCGAPANHERQTKKAERRTASGGRS
jgi:hypothetical protein